MIPFFSGESILKKHITVVPLGLSEFSQMGISVTYKEEHCSIKNELNNRYHKLLNIIISKV